MKVEVYNNIIEIIRMVPVKGFPLSKECMKVLRLTYPMIPESTLKSIYALFYRRKMIERHRRVSRRKQELYNRYSEAVKRGEKPGILLRMSLEVGLSPALLARFMLEQAYLKDSEIPNDTIKNETKNFPQLSLKNSENLSRDYTRKNDKCPESKSKSYNSRNVSNSTEMWKNSNIQFMLSSSGFGFRKDEDVEDVQPINSLPVKRKVNRNISANSFVRGKYDEVRKGSSVNSSPVNSLQVREKVTSNLNGESSANSFVRGKYDDVSKSSSGNSSPVTRKRTDESKGDSPLNYLPVRRKVTGNVNGNLSANSFVRGKYDDVSKSSSGSSSPVARKRTDESKDVFQVNYLPVRRKVTSNVNGESSANSFVRGKYDEGRKGSSVNSSPVARKSVEEFRGDFSLDSFPALGKGNKEFKRDMPVNFSFALKKGKGNSPVSSLPLQQDVSEVPSNVWNKRSESRLNNVSSDHYCSQIIGKRSSEVVVNEKTARKGSSEVVVDGKTVRKGSSEAVVEGKTVGKGSFEAVVNRKTVGEGSSEVVVDGKTVRKGSSEVVVDRITVRKGSSEAVVDGKTVGKGSSEAVVDRKTVRKGSSDAVVDERTVSEAVVDERTVGKGSYEAVVDGKTVETDDKKVQLQTEIVAVSSRHNAHVYTYALNVPTGSIRDCIYGNMPEQVFKNLKWPTNFHRRRNNLPNIPKQALTRRLQKPSKTSSGQHGIVRLQDSDTSLPEELSTKLKLHPSRTGTESVTETSKSCNEKVTTQESLQPEKQCSETKPSSDISDSKSEGHRNIINISDVSKSDNACKAVEYFKTLSFSSSSESPKSDNTPEENYEDFYRESFRENTKHKCHGIFGKKSVFKSWQARYNKALETSNLDDEMDDQVTLSDDLKLILRKINEMKKRTVNSRQDDLSPLDDTCNPITKKDISQMMKDTTLIPDGILAREVFLCNLCDDQYGIISDSCKSSVGSSYEAKLSELATKANLIFRREDNLRDFGFDKTPDFILDIPVAIGENTVCWIESKALFADEQLHKDYCEEQYDKYCVRYGPGLVIYWFGFVEDIREQNPQILIRDNFPRYIKYINYELPDFMKYDLPESVKEELASAP